jgi:hypothetical protein
MQIHACKCFHLEEKVCGKLKFEAILGKFILLGKLKKKFKKKSENRPTLPKFL